MPRVRPRTTVYFCAIVVFLMCAKGLYYTYIKERGYLAQENIFKALGSRHLPSSNVVLPNESTIIVQPYLGCPEEGQDIFALFMVNSSPENRERRDVIRSTWGAHLNSHLGRDNRKNRYYFFVGMSPDNGVHESVIEEWRLHGDIVLDNVIDTYLNLTLKVLRMFKWTQTNCPSANFLVKIDDDVYLNLPKFLGNLKEYSGAEAHSLVGGHLYGPVVPERDPSSKYYVPTEIYDISSYPNFLAGFSYVLGDEAVPKIYQASLQVPIFHLEDVFVTGMIANQLLNMKLSPFPNISTFWSPFYNFYISSCKFTEGYIAIHSVTAKYLKCWSIFNTKDFVCNSWPVFLYC